MSWRLAKALEQLRDEVNARWPLRRKDSDGTIGNAEHASRSSDHNPWVKEGSMGIVTAFDISHDPARGVDTYALAFALAERQDKRIKYIISNRKIISGAQGPSPWLPRKYNGANPHDHHMHVSVEDEKRFYDNAEPWRITELKLGETPIGEHPRDVPPSLRRLSAGIDVEYLQNKLNAHGFKLRVDGSFGQVTEAAVIKFQQASGLVPDGVVGPQTWKALT